jgi:hypothetical protein
MSIWDKYKLNDLPEEQRGDVVKAVAKEVEETNRARLNSSNHQTVRGLAIVAGMIVCIVATVATYYASEGWKEVKIKGLTPMVCPPPPPCPAAPLPSFDVKITPAAPKQ